MKKTIIVKWKIKDLETPRILKLLPELVEKSRREEGNVFYVIYQSENDFNELVLHEQYIDAAAAEAHKQTEHYQQIVVNQIIPHLAIRDITPVKKLY